jgi:subtilisin family serine protease
MEIPEGPIEQFTVIGRSNKIVRLKPVPKDTPLGRLARYSVVTDRRPLGGLNDLVDRVWHNTHFILPFDRPAAAAVIGNEANWGVGSGGIDGNRFWSKGVFGQGVRLGIADTGLDPTHPTFAKLISENRLLAFAHFDAMGQKVVQVDGAGNPLPDTEAVPTFVSWHGTFCAGVLVGDHVDGVLRGVAPKSQLAVARIFNAGNSSSTQCFKSGFQWLADQKCDIVSLSVGWPGLHEEWADDIRELVDNGTVVVAAAGNTFPDPPTWSPANYPVGGLIAVGAMDENGSVWDESGGGEAAWPSTITDANGSVLPSLFANEEAKLPTVVAPGVSVISAAPNNKYRQEDGTSMAVPHIAGLLALILSTLRKKDAAATPAQAAEVLFASLKDLPPAGEDDRSGKGIVDLDGLMSKLAGAFA